MRNLISLILMLLFASASIGQQKNAAKQSAVVKEEGFEMKQYYFVMLKKGSRRGSIKDTSVLNEIQRGHIENINRLAKAGKILVAGPFGDDGEWRGLFIFDASGTEEVEKLLQTDPAIAAGRLDYEIHPWWTAKNAVFK
ncbi:MAG: hypothetical protein EOO89_09715 [Pedobacter sp.]|nr:MAG: hypothetical protein EOO89_09715 [Pedobacter sp.]